MTNENKLQKIRKNVYEDLKNNIPKLKKYKHFDYPLTENSFSRNLVKIYKNGDSFIKHFGFTPLIRVVISNTRYVTDRNERNEIWRHLKKKNRNISLTSHKDALIYLFYGRVLSECYEEYLKDKEYSDSVVAYRKNNSNINGAKRVIDFVWTNRDCWIIKGDFSSFFDNLNHYLLNKNYNEVLSFVNGDKNLNNEWNTVFKQITKFRFVDEKNVRQTCINKNGLPLRYGRKQLDQLIHDKKLKVKKNYKGIPQGTSLSAVLANIYMIEFDEWASELSKKYSGLYQRYSDDFVFVIPKVSITDYDKIQNLKNEIIQKSKKTLYLKIKKEKTKLLQFSDGKILDENNKNKVFSYLGFSFNGSKVYLRSGTTYRFWYRGKKRAKSMARKYNERRVYKLCKQDSEIKGKYLKIRFPDADESIKNYISHEFEVESIAFDNRWEITGKKSFTKMFLIDSPLMKQNMMWYAHRAQEIFEQKIDGCNDIYNVDIERRIKQKVVKIQREYHYDKEKEARKTDELVSKYK
ncbi:reverse transcriptase domain-containing protein [Fructilactobacillus frigidiflavus]|uniref:reverse transcriptase domain-containing protein n=1 Tax=Fructilactobacillus frigidiflavus TaxID=3242688 RepID=UPI003756B00C